MDEEKPILRCKKCKRKEVSGDNMNNYIDPATSVCFYKTDCDKRNMEFNNLYMLREQICLKILELETTCSLTLEENCSCLHCVYKNLHKKYSKMLKNYLCK